MAADRATTVRVDAAGGVGWAADSSTPGWRELSAGSVELGYQPTDRALFGVHGLYQSSARSYALVAGDPPEGRAVVREARLELGAVLALDVLRSWRTPATHRAGLLLEVARLDLDQFQNEVSPIVGFEPGGGVRGYVRLVGPVVLGARASYQWVTDFSARAATARTVRGRPLATLRYDAGLECDLVGAGGVSLGYAGEVFTFEHETTRSHSLLFGVTFHA